MTSVLEEAVLSKKTDVPQVAVLPVDPLLPPFSMLMPFLASRIHTMCREHAQETDPDQFTRTFMAKLWMRNPHVLCLVLLEPNGKLVGHLTAEYCSDGVKGWVFVSQCKADGNVGDAIRRAITVLDAWATGLKATTMTMATHRSDAAWQRKYGLDNHRSVLMRAVGSPIGAPKE